MTPTVAPSAPTAAKSVGGAVRTLPGLSPGRVYNFSAGPGELPEDVLRQIQEDVWNCRNSGIGILEHSHRGKVVDKIFEECESDLRKLANVPANYKILFLTGGASAQNHMIPMNWMPPGKTGDYLVTGNWSQKTWEQAQKFSGKPGFGTAHLAVTTKDKNHSYIPDDAAIKYSSNPAFIHYCSNNTLYGTEWHRIPKTPAGVPLICDTSSHMYSKPIDLARYAMVYAGAQKNLGPAGVTLCIAREDFIELGSKDIADLLQYRSYVPEFSRPNTPPVFAVYVMGLVAKWIQKFGGLAAMERHNQAKAHLIYDALDTTKFYQPHAQRDARSLMNITFRLPSEELTDKFVKEASAQGMDGLKGHRSVGGIRASIYNAFPIEGCKALGEFLREFAKRNG
jgi:phosphoserine aminotransferase